MLVSDIEQRLVEVRQRIDEAVARGTRDPRTIRLLVVSKTQPVASIEQAYRAGQRAFAENRVQEWLEKAPLLPNDCEWHLVGRLQTNKVKYLDQNVTMIHSLDRFPLLEALNAHGERRGITWSTLVQVNIAKDPAKAGLAPEEVPDFLNSIRDFPFVRVHGLMTIGAMEASIAETQEFFRQLRDLRDTLQSRKWDGVELRELSMGMSQDFELAIEEGATFVRVGRQIFGERDNVL
ncbi:YggS family pyridoxal phosphate-dependent enzyme [Desulfosporosinus sp. BICA1-9]|uniref:YggS family pyridoxal phosphate-dependent enzyme n=1 Tax=Desulfosporosinus sp. BICA1-9 TaxID=1531958 RepID=UPI0005F1C181|nr:YggS family pyridoxal phosphate-dependent enzyme [Desulfosporosinus sp. BICA1-9]KJS50868.1 MAG: pyridoxal phosphate biosynthesis protein [Peptococcaceae bacterium BRH_c23]KJS79444.1 MAG: pyridoxal phosphate biosynthesis protein [Desulfosporosinus sp. BICA1-9]HBW34249.1 YggS family pyridoxal phosphate-dependent enzyme [Desulfosporosinus sp.]